MSLITRIRHQTALYWENKATQYDNYGNMQREDPIEISCRWQDVNEEFIDPQGERQVSSAKVFVGVDIEPGALLKLGTAGDLESGLLPEEQSGVYEVKKFEKIPDFKANEYLRIVYL